MATLSVNVDHVATVRQARLDREPDPVTAALKAELAGADGITIHLREDRRHIQDRDLHILSKVVKTRLNLEMAATAEMLGIALEVKPHQVTLVPEKRRELTTEGGLDVKAHSEYLEDYIAQLQEGGVPVNLFVDPAPDAVKASHRIGSSGVEIHTGAYAEAGPGDRGAELKKILDAVKLASRLGMKVHAGHGLDYENVRPLTGVTEIDEFAIGFSIIARSVYVGVDSAVREMAGIIRAGA